MKLYKIFILLLSGTVFLLSCGKPNDPESLKKDDTSGGYVIVKKVPTSGYAQDVLKNDDLLYIAQGEGGLEILDITNPEDPQIVSITSDGVRGYSTKIAMRDSIVYLAAGSFGVTTVNVSNPMAPTVPGSNSSDKPARGLHMMGNYLFVAVSEQGVKISDISLPAYPDPRGSISTSGYAYSLATSSDSAYMFVACGEMGMYIIDISNFEQGWPIYHEVAWCDTPGKAESITILEDESLAFLACGTAGLQIINYSDTNNMHIVGSFDGGGYAKSLIYKNQRIFMTAELAGLQVIDVSDVTNPFLIGEIATEFALGIDIDDQYIYIADETEGLIIVSIPD